MMNFAIRISFLLCSFCFLPACSDTRISNGVKNITLVVPDGYLGDLEIVIGDYPDSQSGHILRFDLNGRMYLKDHYQEEFHYLSVIYEGGENIVVSHFDDYDVGDIIFREQEGKFDVGRYYYRVEIYNESPMASKSKKSEAAGDSLTSLLPLSTILSKDCLDVDERHMELQYYFHAIKDEDVIKLLSDIVENRSVCDTLRQLCIETLVVDYSTDVEICHTLLLLATNVNESIKMREHVIWELPMSCSYDPRVIYELERLLNNANEPMEIRKAAKVGIDRIETLVN